jgi:hypothetical protein
MSVPELIYFPCYGRGGLTKLIFKLGHVEFKDTVVDSNNWESDKSSKLFSYFWKLLILFVAHVRFRPILFYNALNICAQFELSKNLIG